VYIFILVTVQNQSAIQVMSRNAERSETLDAPGTLHHVIIRWIERCAIFTDDEDRNEFLCRMGTLARGSGTAIYAYALITNHLHLLLKSGESGLSTYMRC